MTRLLLGLLLLAGCQKQDRVRPATPAATPVVEAAAPEPDAAGDAALRPLPPEPDGGGKQLDFPGDTTGAQFSTFMSKTYPGGMFTDGQGVTHDCKLITRRDAKGKFFEVKATIPHASGADEVVGVRMRPFGDTFKCESVVTAQHGCARLGQECRGK